MREESRWRRYRRLFPHNRAAEIDDELSFHLLMKEEELRAKGVPAGRARHDAAEAFGDRRRIERELRRMGEKRTKRARRAGVVDALRTDVWQSWRSFVRAPAIPLLVVGMLAVGIGAGTAVFSLVDAVLLNPVRVTAADELLVLNEGEAGERRGIGFSYPMLNALRQAEQHAADVAGHLRLSAGARVGGHAEQAYLSLVTGNYFRVLGIKPQQGRLLAPSDEAAPGATPYVVVSDAFWRRVLGADPAAVGRTIHVNEAPLEVIGVAPAGFRGTTLSEPVDLWLPITMAQYVGRGALWSSPEILTTWYFTVIEGLVRLRPGSSEAAALAELRALHAAATAQMPEQEFRLSERVERTVVAMPFREAAAARGRSELLLFIRVLVLVVGACLAVACVNVANLMMIRARERAADMSVRAALGADRGRLFRQLLLEGGLLGAAAGAVGVLVAAGAMRLLSPFALPGNIALADVSLPLDARVLGFTAAASLLCALCFGLAPALTGARTAVMQTLRQNVHGAGRRGWSGGTALVGVQVALALVLLVAAGLLIRSLQEGLAVDPRFETRGAATLAVGLEHHGYRVPAATGFVRAVVDDVASRPGIAAAAAATKIPIDSDALRFHITPAAGGERQRLAVVGASPGYFDLLGIALVRGRDFAWTDGEDAPPVAIISESAARALWPEEHDALGRELVVMFGAPYRVIGIVRDAHFTSLSSMEPHVFLSLPQTMGLGAMGRLMIAARGREAGSTLVTLRSAVREHDPRLPTFRERLLTDQIDIVLMPQRFGALLLGAFGLIAILIAGVGIYAVAAFDVARRRRELGIRSALGAQSRSLIRAVLLRSGTAITVGAAAGLVLAAAASRALESLLFGITTLEPLSYIAAATLVACVAILASWMPARRAARVDPLSVIREQ